MDPDENLRKQRALRHELASRELDVDGTSDALLELLDLTEALDDWLAKGGFLPRAWSSAPASDTSLGGS